MLTRIALTNVVNVSFARRENNGNTAQKCCMLRFQREVDKILARNGEICDNLQSTGDLSGN